jgi:hypothetical protein
LDGINHCHACLRELAARGEQKHEGWLGRYAAGVLFFLMGWLPLLLLFYVLQGRLAP